MLAGLLSAGGWFAAFLALQLGAFRVFGVRHRSRFIIRLFSVSLIAHVLTVALLPELAPSADEAPYFKLTLSAICGLLLMLCLLVLYMPLFYTLSTSLSVELLVMLAIAPGRRLAVGSVRDRFTSIAFIRDRLHTMQANRYLLPDDKGGWALTQRGWRVARAFRGVKELLALGPGG